MSRMHYIPGKAWSYPSDSRRPTMRTYYPHGNVPVCGRAPFGDGTDDPDLVTCSTCHKRMVVGRFDDEEVTEKLAAPAAPQQLEGDEPTPEQIARMKWHHTLALIHGFNVMATKAITLGEKVYYRLARDEAERHFTEMGGKIDRVDEHKLILVIPGAVPEVRFDARDIELMRECVARYDAAAGDRPDSATNGGDRG